MASKRLWIFLVSLVLAVSTMSVTSPTQAAEGDPVFDMVATGRDHTCALADGYVWCWGANDDGQLGTPSDEPVVGDPLAVEGISTAVEITAGANHTCARLEDGSARCWGANNVGQLGDGTTVDRPTPVAVVNLPAIKQISAGRAHTCAIAEDTSAVYCWGSNGDGQLGVGSVQDVPHEFQPAAGTDQVLGWNSAAADPSGDVLISDSVGRTVNRYSPQGHLIQRWDGSELTAIPTYTAFANGVAYVAVGATVYRLRANRSIQLVETYPSAVTGLEGDETGALYVSYQVGTTVTVLKTGASGWTRSFNPGTGIASVTDIALDPADVEGGRRLYVATATSDYRVKFLSAATGAPQGSILTLLPPGNTCSHYLDEDSELPQTNHGARIGISADGELLVSPHRITRANGVGGCIDSYDRQGDYIDSFQPAFAASWYWLPSESNDIAGTADGGAVMVDVSAERVRKLSSLSPSWARNTSWGQLGFALEPRRVTALESASLNGVPIQVAAGGLNTCVFSNYGVGTNPLLMCWGSNGSNQLAIDEVDATSWPRFVLGELVADVAVGQSHWCAIALDRASMTCRGLNTMGQLGGGDFDASVNTVTLTDPEGDDVEFADVSLGTAHTCASTTKGFVRCWGDPQQWGDGGDLDWFGWVRTSDPDVSNDPNEEYGHLVGTQQISASIQHTCALNEGGSIHCWGSNEDALKNIVDRDAFTGRADLIELSLDDRVGGLAPDGLDGALTVDFGATVSRVRPTNVVATAPDGVPMPATTLTCRNAEGESVGCTSGSAWYADLSPSKPWTLGATYLVDVNQPGAPAVSVAGIALPAQQVEITVPAKQQESVAGGSYSWPESNVPARRAFGGDFTWSRTPGATATYRFKGDAIEWITALGPKEGRVAVSVDGGRAKTFNNQAAKLTVKHARTLSGYGKGPHTIRFEVLATSADNPTAAGRIVIDAFRTKKGIVESPRIRYTWATAASDGVSDGGYAWSVDKGATFRLRFWGESIVLHTLVGPGQGDLLITVDGEETPVSAYDDTGPVEPGVLGVGGLDNGPHQLTVEVLGTGAGARHRVVIDAVEAGGVL